MIEAKKLFTTIMLLFPLVCNYDFIGISPILLFCAFEFILSFFCLSRKKIFEYKPRIFVYLLYMLLSAAFGIVHSAQNSLYTIIIKCVLYVLFFFVFYVYSWQAIDLKYFMNLYIRIAIVVSVLVIIQFGFSLTGHGFSMIPPGIRLVSDDLVTSDYIRSTQINNNRFSSVFLEPAHQCEYVIPCLAICLFRENRRSKKGADIGIAVLLTIGCFCTTSTIGILSSVIMWAFWGLLILKQKKANGFLYFVVLLPVVLIIFSFFMSYKNVSENLLTRLAVLDYKNTSMTEGFRRVRYGWICFGDMELIRKIFGAGYKNFGYYIAEIGTGFRFYKTDDISWISYTNGITGMLIGLGVVGTILYFRIFLWDLFRSKNILVYGLLLSWALIMFTSNSFDDPIGMMPIVIAMAVINFRDNNRYVALLL